MNTTNLQTKLENAIKENSEAVLMLILLHEKISIRQLLALSSDDVDEDSCKVNIKNIVKLNHDNFEIIPLDNTLDIPISRDSMRLLIIEVRKRLLLSKKKKSCKNNSLIFADITGTLYKPSYYISKFQELSCLLNFNVTPKFLTDFEYVETEKTLKSPYIGKITKNRSCFADYCKTELDNMQLLTDNERKKLNLILEKHLNQFCIDFQVNQIDDDFKIKLLYYLKAKRCKLSTRETIIDFLSRICELALRKNFIRYNPFIDVYLDADPAIKYHSLTDDEIYKIMKLDSHDIYNAFLQVKLLTATRTSETLGLLWSDVLYNNGQILIRHQLKNKKIPVLINVTKNYRDRKIIPPAITFDILDKIRPVTLLNKHNNLRLVFCHENGVPLSSKILHDRLRAIIGRNNVRLHDLRVTAITVLYKTTKNLTLTAKFAGHLDTNVTVKHYVDVIPDLSKAKSAQDKYYKEMKQLEKN